MIAAYKFAFSLALAVAFFVTATACQQKEDREAQGTPLELTLAVHGTPYSGLIAVADEKGFFKESGLKAKINLYASGLESLTAMTRGEAQVATVADIAFAIRMLEDPSLRTIASIGTSLGSQVVARKDHNISTPADLKGKRVGYSPLTSSDYYLHAFLVSNSLSRDDVTAVPIPPPRQAEALIAGEIDALSAFDVYAYNAKKNLGENAAAWDIQGNVDFQWLLATTESCTQSPEATKRLLKALIMAEEFALNHVDEAKSIIARKWEVDPEYVRYTWDQSRLFVSLNQSVITALQSYAKWKIYREGKMDAPPDVLSFVYTAALEQINPRLVTIPR